MPRTDRTRQRTRDVFVAALARGLSITGALDEARLARRTAYDWRNTDADFAALWEEAVEAGSDFIEDEARRRAVEGCEEPIVAMGKVARNEDGSVMTVRKYSDTLMTLILKARRPEKYRERVSTEISGGVTIAITPDDAEL